MISQPWFVKRIPRGTVDMDAYHEVGSAFATRISTLQFLWPYCEFGPIGEMCTHTARNGNPTRDDSDYYLASKGLG